MCPVIAIDLKTLDVIERKKSRNLKDRSRRFLLDDTNLEYEIGIGYGRFDDQIVEKLPSDLIERHWPSVVSYSY